MTEIGELILNYKKIADTAMLAGKIMLESNAETYRVEETVQHILRVSQLTHTEAFVLPTGIMITLDDTNIEAISLIHRIKSRSTDLHKIHKVNHISRQLAQNTLTIDDAYQQLKKVDTQEYHQRQVNIAIVILAISFAVMLGGSVFDALVTLFNGLLLISIWSVGRRYNLSLFFANVIGAMATAYIATLMVKHFPQTFMLDPIITGSIMPMVPGTIVTNAIRDTFHGDFTSGIARGTEAVFIALSIALGVAIGLTLAGGGGLI